jgi:hypothetical protein
MASKVRIGSSTTGARTAPDWKDGLKTFRWDDPDDAES